MPVKMVNIKGSLSFPAVDRDLFMKARVVLGRKRRPGELPYAIPFLGPGAIVEAEGELYWILMGGIRPLWGERGAELGFTWDSTAWDDIFDDEPDDSDLAARIEMELLAYPRPTREIVEADGVLKDLPLFGFELFDSNGNRVQSETLMEIQEQYKKKVTNIGEGEQDAEKDTKGNVLGLSDSTPVANEDTKLNDTDQKENTVD